MMLYILKSALVLALLYSCFFALLSKETFHRFNRAMLLGIMALSLVLPLVHITVEEPTVLTTPVHEVETIIVEAKTIAMPVVMPQAPKMEKRTLSWSDLAKGIYIAGVAVMLIVLIMRVCATLSLMRGGIRHTDDRGNTVILRAGKTAPFSIFRFIVMSVDDYEHNRSYILTHEQEHIRLHHTYDLLLLQAVKTLQWFNPFIWFMAKDLEAVHEYEADEAVLNHGIDAQSYQKLIVIKVVGNRLQPFAHSLNRSSLKKRIIMMKQSKSNRWMMLKALFALPVIGISIGAFATTETAKTLAEAIALPVISESPNETVEAVSQPTNTETIIPNQPTETDDTKPDAPNGNDRVYAVCDPSSRIIRFTTNPNEEGVRLNFPRKVVLFKGYPITDEQIQDPDIMKGCHYQLIQIGADIGVHIWTADHGHKVSDDITEMADTAFILNKTRVSSKTFCSIPTDELQYNYMEEGEGAMLQYHAKVAIVAETNPQPGESIIGHVLDKSNNHADLAGATVSEVTHDGTVVNSTITDRNGRFELRIMNPKNGLRLSKVGYNTENLDCFARDVFFSMTATTK